MMSQMIRSGRNSSNQAQPGQAVFAATRDVVFGLQQIEQTVADAAVVFDNQNLGGHAATPLSGG